MRISDWSSDVCSSDLGGRIDDVIDRLHREVEGHELDDRAQAAHRRARAEPGKAVFGDRRIDAALVAELVEQSLRDLVRALIFLYSLTHHHTAGIGAHCPRHPSTHRTPAGPLDTPGAPRHAGI